MLITNKHSPWSYILVNDFLSPEDFEIVNKYSLEEVYHHKHDLYRTEWTNRNRDIPDHVVEPLLESLAELYGKPIVDNYKITFDNIVPDWQYKVHADNPNKLFTFVLHLSDNGKGTKIDDTYTPWIVNGGMGFHNAPHKKHSFDTLGATDIRRTVILNVTT